MGDDDKKAGTGISDHAEKGPKLDTAIEIPKNYFKAVNEAYEELEAKGQKPTEEEVDRIVKENEEMLGSNDIMRFVRKLSHAIDEPFETFKWVDKTILGGLFSAWIFDRKKITEKFDEAKDWAHEEMEKLGIGGEKRKDGKKEEEHREKLKRDYGEFVPLKEAIGNYQDDLELVLNPIVKFADEHKAEIAIAGALSLALAPVRNVFVGGVTKASHLGFEAGGKTFDVMVKLATFPFRSLKGFALSSLFGITAALLAKELKPVIHESGEIMVPKDTNNLIKYVTAKVQDLYDIYDDLPIFPYEQIKLAIKIIKQPKKILEYIGDAKDLVYESVEAMLEKFELDPSEFIQETNVVGIKSFLHDLRRLELSADRPEEKTKYQALQEKVKAWRKRVWLGDPLKKEEIIPYLEADARPIGIEIFFQDGYVQWHKLRQDGPPEILEEHKICVDPTLSVKDGAEKARWFSSYNLGILKILKANTLDYVRMGVGGVLFKTVKTEKEGVEVLEKKLRGGGSIVVIGITAYLVEAGEGFFYKHIIGPLNVFWKFLPALVKTLSGKPGSEGSIQEYLVQWSSGLIPVWTLGTASALARLNFKNFGMQVIVKGALYPAVGLGETAQFSWRHIKPNLGKLSLRHPVQGTLDFMKAIAENPYVSLTSEWKAASYRWLRVAHGIRGLPDAMKGLDEKMISYFEALSHLSRSKYQGITNLMPFYSDAKEALKNTGYEPDINTGTVDDVIREVQQKINGGRQCYLKHTQNQAIREAIDLLGLGKEEKAKALLRSVDYDGPLTKEAFEAKMAQNTKAIEDYVGKERAKGKAAPSEMTEEQKGSADELKKKQLIELQREIEVRREALKQGKQHLVDDAAKAGKATDDPHLKDMAKACDELIDELNAEHELRKKAILDGKPIDPEKAAVPIHGETAGTPIAPLKGTERYKAILRQRMRQGWRAGKTGAKGLAAAAGLTIGYMGLRKLFDELFPGEKLEKFDPEKDIREGKVRVAPEEKRKEEVRQEQLKRSPGAFKDIVIDLQKQLADCGAVYETIPELLDYQTSLKTMSHGQLIDRVEKIAAEHEKNMTRVRELVTRESSRTALQEFFSRHEDQRSKEQEIIETYVSLGYDSEKKTVFLKYISTDDLKSEIYAISDNIWHWKGETPTKVDIFKDSGYYIIPGVGTGADLVDTVTNVRRGEFVSAAKSGFWTVVGLASDIALVTVVGVKIGIGLRALRVAALAGKIGKGIKAASEGSKLARAAVIAGETGAKIGTATMDAGRKIGEVTHLGKAVDVMKTHPGKTLIGVSVGRMAPDLYNSYFRQKRTHILYLH